MRAFLIGALLAACGSSPPPVETVAQEPEAQQEEPEAQPQEPEAQAEEPVLSPVAPPPPETPQTNTIAAPIAADARLAPCAVELVHTTYDEETREPTEQRVAVRRLVREWT